MKQNKRYKRLKTAKWISIRELVPGLLLTVRSAGRLVCSSKNQSLKITGPTGTADIYASPTVLIFKQYLIWRDRLDISRN